MADCEPDDQSDNAKKNSAAQIVATIVWRAILSGFRP